jgi:taurine dioxygenase
LAVPQHSYNPEMTLKITPLRAALGAVVEGLAVDDLSDAGLHEVGAELLDSWHRYEVLFFPALHLTTPQQVRLAGVFGPKLAATTETGGDYRDTNTLAAEGYPQVLVLDTAEGLNPKVTAAWHTDVTFTENPPIGSLFNMQIPATSGGDTMWSSQTKAYATLNPAIQRLIGDLHGVHGRPPQTGTSVHPMMKHHPADGRPFLYVNRGWTTGVKGMSGPEATHLLAMLFEMAERPELQVRWQWSAGDAALWDNRCTMHFAIHDYGSERRRAQRVTIYDNA